MKRGCIVLLISLAATSPAMFAMPSTAPLTRLLANAKEKARLNPADVHSQYLLARLHSLAYARDEEQVYVYDPDKVPYISYPTQIPYERHTDVLPVPATEHLIKSLAHYSRLLGLDSKVGVYWLGYGWMLEEAARWESQLPKSGEGFPVGSQPDRWYKAASEAYRTAFHKSSAADLAQNHRLEHMEKETSIEAANNLFRMDKAGQIKLTAVQKRVLARHVKAVEKLPQMVTPIVFPLTANTAFEEIDRTDISVPFDLDGMKSGKRWSWISPQSAFLAWDPEGDGVIDSGRDLFGNATFWMFFANGYDALAALDDNRDGWLRGPELRFIVAWRDLNSDGISQPGEVQPLSVYGITGIAAHSDGRAGATWLNRAGLETWNGSYLPTYDWIGHTVP